MKIYHIDDLKQEEEIPGFLKNQMTRNLVQLGKLEWLDEKNTQLKVRILHKKDIKSTMQLMQLKTLCIILNGEFGQGRVSFGFSPDNKYLIFEENKKNKG